MKDVRNRTRQETTSDQLAAADPESLKIQLLTSFTEAETTFRQHYPIIWITTLAGPFVISIILLLILGWTLGWEYPRNVISHAFLAFFILGRFIILVGMEGDLRGKITMNPEDLFVLVTYMDFVSALFVAFHMGILFRLPIVGQKIAALVWDGKYLLDSYAWIKRMAFLGLVLFVIFPTSTTGSVGGSILGRLLGMSRGLTVLGVLLGSLLGNALMYFFSKQINQFITPETVWVKVVGFVVLIALIILVEVRYQRIKKKYFRKGATV